MDHASRCPVCSRPADPAVLAEARWYPYWKHPGGGCPACVQQHLLETLLSQGEEGLHEGIQSYWPLDAESAFGALPTPLRLHADPRFQGRRITIAILDAGFYPHPDLIQPRNRIRAWVNAGGDLEERCFSATEIPSWPGWDKGAGHQWHGLMTSCAAAGNGFLSHGLYAGLASEADIVLIQVRNAEGEITDRTILNAFAWLEKNAARCHIRVASLSVSGDSTEAAANNSVDAGIERLVRQGICIVAAAGNDGVRRLIPPATAPLALTIGGIDDKNTFHHEEIELWHSNYGSASNLAPKPEIVAPSIWLAAPLLPHTETASEARELFERRGNDGEDRAEIEERTRELKLITPHYQHVDGTSFATPIVASTIACMLEANPSLTPALVRDILLQTAEPVPSAPRERQGAGAVAPGRAVARALSERHAMPELLACTPMVASEGVIFHLHDHHAKQVRVYGSWDAWSQPGIPAHREEAGLWKTKPLRLRPGKYAYKFLLGENLWLDDPANPRKSHDGKGGLNSVFVVGPPRT